MSSIHSSIRSGWTQRTSLSASQSRCYSSSVRFCCDAELSPPTVFSAAGTGFPTFPEAFRFCILRTSSGLETPKIESARPILLKNPLDISSRLSFYKCSTCLKILPAPTTRTQPNCIEFFQETINLCEFKRKPPAFLANCNRSFRAFLWPAAYFPHFPPGPPTRPPNRSPIFWCLPMEIS